MDLRQLRYFIAVAEESSVSRAAVRLGLAQPSLSQQLRALERELGVPLLDRSSRPVRLTAAGQVLLEQARELLAKAQAAAEATHRAGRRSLRLGYPAAEVPDLPVRILTAFRRREPGVTVEQHTVDTATRLTHLRDGLLDAAFVRLSRPPGGGLEFLLLQLDPLLVALPAMHPLAAREVIPLAALNNQPLAFYPRDQNPAWYDEVHHALAQAGAQMRTVREASDPMSNLPTVAAGQALTFLSAPLARALRYADVTVRPLGPPRLAVGLGLAWRGGDTAGPVATLVRVARQHQTRSASSARPLPPAARG